MKHILMTIVFAMFSPHLMANELTFECVGEMWLTKGASSPMTAALIVNTQTASAEFNGTTYYQTNVADKDRTYFRAHTDKFFPISRLHSLLLNRVTGELVVSSKLDLSPHGDGVFFMGICKPKQRLF